MTIVHKARAISIGAAQAAWLLFLLHFLSSLGVWGKEVGSNLTHRSGGVKGSARRRRRRRRRREDGTNEVN